MSAQLAASLLKGHRVRMSRAIARQIQQLVPRYRELDATVIERNAQTLMVGMEQLLERGDDHQLMDVMRNIMQLRALSGFEASEFLMAMLAFLPVCRRFLLERCRTVEEALRAYDAVEAIALPLLGRVVAMYNELDTGAQTEPEGYAFEHLFREAGSFKPSRIEAVVGPDADER